MKKLLLILMAFCISVIGYAQTFTALDNNNNTLEFNITSATTVEVKDYISGGTDVDIPTTITDNSTTYNVTGIGILAFLSNGLTSVVIPNSITSIGVGAFQNNSLTSITIPNGVTTISNNAFSTNQLISVTIPAGVTSIGNNAFLNNNQLTSVSFSEGLTSIGNDAFLNCQLSSLTLPSTLTSIGMRAFINNPLSSVITLSITPPSITTTPGNGGADTFAADRSGIDLTIPAGTTGAYVTDAGALWTGFNTVTENLNVGNTYVYNYITYQVISVANSTVRAFDYNTAGGTVVDIPATIPNGLITYTVTEIGNSAFASNNLNDPNNLTSVTLPNTITYIGVSAFFINNITTLTIPDSVINIDNGAFANSQNLTNLVLGNNLTTIGDFAFRFCPLNDITIPASVTDIGVIAFGGMGGFNAIMDIYCLGSTPPTIATDSNLNADTFNQSRSTIHLHIPAGTMGAYVTDPGALWTGFNPVTEDALSIDEFELANSVKIITANDAINIISDHSLQLQDYTMYSISGMEIVRGKESNIPTSSFASGVYILKLNFDRGTITKKVIIN